MTLLSIEEARQKRDLVRASLVLDGAVAELCSYPQVKEQRAYFVESETILALALSRVLNGSAVRLANDALGATAMMGGLTFRPSGIPMEYTIPEGSFETVRLRFTDNRIARLLAGRRMDSLFIAACYDIRSAPIEDAMLRIARELQRPRPDSRDMANALLDLLLIELARYLEDATRHTRRRRGGLLLRSLRTATAMIERNNAPPPTIDELAAACGLSRYHFIRSFTESTGIGPGTAIRRHQLDRAKIMLLTGDASIEKVAHAIGYSGAPAFCAAFRRETGRTPAAWRNQMR